MEFASSGGGPLKRELTPADEALLREATLLNLNWSGQRFSMDDVLAEPSFAHYTRLVSGRGDFGVVVEQDSRWVGVVWVLMLPATDPGYGFVAEGIGEVSVCVDERHRGRGIGRQLMMDALAFARSRGDSRLSLSVEEGNPARSLYSSLGFKDAGAEAIPGTMVVDLRS
ncbi:GNAT family N-acetyltransferase [Ornithinimicrobium sp. Arc0846-15]|nr:GNAT family N-acetyltransferase [Ornithinimicrobium laminariae]